MFLNNIDEEKKFHGVELLMMMQPGFKELSHNETYVGLQGNDGFLASFMSTHDKGNCSSSDIVVAPEFYGQALNDYNVVQTVEDTIEGNFLFEWLV